MPSSGDLRRRDQPTVTAVPPPLREGDVVLLAAFVRTAGEVRARGCGCGPKNASPPPLRFLLLSISFEKNDNGNTSTLSLYRVYLSYHPINRWKANGAWVDILFNTKQIPYCIAEGCRGKLISKDRKCDENSWGHQQQG